MADLRVEWASIPRVSRRGFGRGAAAWRRRSGAAGGNICFSRDSPHDPASVRYRQVSARPAPGV